MVVRNSILLLANYCQSSGGISTQIEILNRLLQQEGYKTGIFSLKGNPLFRLKAIFKLKTVGKNYDIIHIHACSHWGFLPAIVGIRVGKKLGQRIVLTYHGGNADEFFEKHKRLVKKYLGKTDVNIVLSGYLKDVFKRYKIPCITIPNIIELKKGVYRERSEILPHFIGIRSLTPTYNILCTIKAFQKVKQLYPQASLTLLGDGPLRKELELYISEQHISDVSFEGRVPNDKIYDFLDKSDIMLSSPFIDNMPISLLEGFNAGLLVISSNVGGVPYMINDGESGLLFTSDNSDEMADKMIEAIKNQERSKKMIRAAHDGLKAYSWECNKEKYFKIYQ